MRSATVPFPNMIETRTPQPYSQLLHHPAAICCQSIPNTKMLQCNPIKTPTTVRILSDHIRCWGNAMMWCWRDVAVVYCQYIAEVMWCWGNVMLMSCIVNVMYCQCIVEGMRFLGNWCNVFLMYITYLWKDAKVLLKLCDVNETYSTVDVLLKLCDVEGM